MALVAAEGARRQPAHVGGELHGHAVEAGGAGHRGVGGHSQHSRDGVALEGKRDMVGLLGVYTVAVVCGAVEGECGE